MAVSKTLQGSSVGERSESLVTVGVPVYNGERFLAQCLDSLLSQTFQDFVLVISDNASTDGTPEICRRYAASDPRIRYHRNATNIGLYGNFNWILRTARTRYIKLASADDFWASTMLSDAVTAIESDPSVVLCYPRAILVDEKGRELCPYEKSLNVMDEDPVIRFTRVITEIGLVNQLMGVIRCDVLRFTLDLMSQPPADTVFLAELSLYGKIMELPAYQYFRRFHEAASSWDRSSVIHQIQRVSSEGTRRIGLPRWKYYGGLVRRVLHSPLTFGKKAALLQFLGRQMVWDRSVLLDECSQLLPLHRSQGSMEPK
jgi:glycosyltransferase involved in cell wall biosynthesis